LRYGWLSDELALEISHGGAPVEIPEK